MEAVTPFKTKAPKDALAEQRAQAAACCACFIRRYEELRMAFTAQRKAAEAGSRPELTPAELNANFNATRMLVQWRRLQRYALEEQPWEAPKGHLAEVHLAAMREAMRFLKVRPDWQRLVGWKNLSKMLRDMGNGEFRKTITPYLVELPDGAKLLLDGQHQLMARAVSLNGPQRLHETVDPVDDLSMAKKEYLKIDVGQRRSAAQMANATELDDLGNSAKERLIAAMHYLTREQGPFEWKNDLSLHELIALARTWLPDLYQLKEHALPCLCTSYNKKEDQGKTAKMAAATLSTAAPLALILLTVREHGNNALRVWSETISGEGEKNCLKLHMLVNSKGFDLSGGQHVRSSLRLLAEGFLLALHGKEVGKREEITIGGLSFPPRG